MIVNQSDLGINLSELLNSITVLIVDQEGLSWDILSRTVMNFTVGYKMDNIPVMIYPFEYAEENSVPFEKQYNLWVLSMQSANEYLQYMHRSSGSILNGRTARNWSRAGKRHGRHAAVQQQDPQHLYRSTSGSTTGYQHEYPQLRRITTYELEDEGHWFNPAPGRPLLTRPSGRSAGREDLAREAGRYVASGQAASLIKRNALVIMQTARLIPLFGRSASTLKPKGNSFKTRKLGPTRSELRSTPVPAFNEKALPVRKTRMALRMPGAGNSQKNWRGIEHPVCFHKGGDLLRLRCDVGQIPIPALEEDSAISAPSADSLMPLCRLPSF